MTHRSHRIRKFSETTTADVSSKNKGDSSADGRPKGENMLSVDDLNTWINRGKREVFTVTVDMTPELAQRILDRNQDNRPLRLRGAKRSVQAYADAMRRDEWLLNGQAIIVSSAGQLNDGQHRLNAVIEAEKTVPMMLTFGVERDSRHTVDQGAARTPAQILSMYGEKNTSGLATATGFVWMYDTNRMNADSYPSSEEMMDTLDQNPMLRDMVMAVNPLARQFRISPGYTAGAAVVCARHNENVLYSFLHALSTGIGIDSDKDPVFVLRKKLLQHVAQVRAHNKISSMEQAAIFIKTFNAFRKGRQVGALRWPHQEGEAFPRVC